MFMYHADCIGQEKNCQYRHRVEITDEASLLEVVRHDYVCAEYQDGYRSNNNFIGSDCVAMDFDNDHSENQKTGSGPSRSWMRCRALPLPSTTAGTTCASRKENRQGRSSM